jgi:hypothetical protein
MSAVVTNTTRYVHDVLDYTWDRDVDIELIQQMDTQRPKRSKYIVYVFDTSNPYEDVVLKKTRPMRNRSKARRKFLDITAKYMAA